MLEKMKMVLCIMGNDKTFMSCFFHETQSLEPSCPSSRCLKCLGFHFLKGGMLMLSTTTEAISIIHNALQFTLQMKKNNRVQLQTSGRGELFLC